jgi:CHAT domain-containing protein
MRSRALLDMLSGNLDMTDGGDAADPVQVQVDTELKRLREELNWQLSAIHGWPGESQSRQSRQARRQALRSARVLEDEFKTLMRQRRLLGSPDVSAPNASVVDVATVRAYLAPDQALIEYAIIGEEVLAFVVARDSISLVRQVCSATEVGYLIDRLHAGLQRYSYEEGWTTRYGAELLQTTERHLARLGEALLIPLATALSRHNRLVIAPHGPLHYVPFHALHGPSGALLDSHETVVAPSASVWAMCMDRAHAAAATPPAEALILGVDDEQARWMLHEARSIGRLFPGAHVRLGPEASVESVFRDAPECDMLHLACHGVFRSDAPLFSALRLADGWLTVHDIYSLQLRAQLVTLSGCQTGRQSIGPGDDLMGLARGFFFAGAQQLLVSLWTVNDASTSLFMEHFYRMYCQGLSAPAALRVAQRALRERFPSPYHWAPFAVIGAG